MAALSEVLRCLRDDDRWSPHVDLRLAGAGGAYRASPVVYEINDERGIVVYVGQTGGPVLLDTDGSSPPRAGRRNGSSPLVIPPGTVGSGT